MVRRDPVYRCVTAVVLASLAVLAASVSLPAADALPSRSPVRIRSPLAFEPNQGQAGPQVKFVSRGARYTLFLYSTHTELHVGRSTVRMKFRGSNPQAEITGADLLPGRSNYFHGSDASQWHTNIPHYSKIVSRNLYPGIDLIHYGSNGQLEFDFVVHPGADPRAIQLEAQGAKTLRLNEAGDLIVSTPGGDVLLNAPVVYQERRGLRQAVAGGFRFRGKNRVAFRLGPYDHSLPLVIDPVFSFATYLGGTNPEAAIRVAADTAGNLYAAGSTCSADFPTANALQSSFAGGANPCNDLDHGDAFVSKFNPDGSALLYSTFLGGSDKDMALGLAVDSSGNAYVSGSTRSTNFPTTNGAFQTTFAGGNADAFVAKLSSDGSTLVYSTYLGGSSVGTDEAQDLAIDTAGNAYVTGNAESTDFPTTMGAFQTTFGGPIGDAFVTKVNTAGTALVYSTFLGGSSDDVGRGIAVDSLGNAYIIGSTVSTDFPTHNPLQAANAGNGDNFVAKLNTDGSALVYSTYLGGSGQEGHEILGAIAVDTSGNAYIVGQTGSSDFPVTQGAFQTTFGGGLTLCPTDFAACGDAYVAKLNSDGSALVYATFLGGSEDDSAAGIALDAGGNAYVTGLTESNNFPTVDPIQATFGGGTCVRPDLTQEPCADAFITKLNPDGTALLFSTYLGGSKDDAAIDIAVDSAGSIYLSGGTNSTDFPTVHPFQATLLGGFDDGQLGGGLDAIVAKIPGPPAVNPGGVVGSADYGADLPGGGIGALFGLNVAPRTEIASMVPLPTTLADTTVTITGIASGPTVLQAPVEAPLFFVSPLQVNFQMPWEVQDDTQVEITVTVGGTTSNMLTIGLPTLGPAIYSINQQGNGQGAILIANTPTFAAPVGSIPGANSQPAVHGTGFLEIYCTGLGRVTDQPPSGSAALANPLSHTISTPTVTIGGVQASVLFSGLAPGFVGLYVVDVQVPAGAPLGDAIPVVLTVNGVMSNTVTIAVQ